MKKAVFNSLFAATVLLFAGNQAAAQEQNTPQTRGIDPVFYEVRPPSASVQPDKKPPKRPSYQRISQRINSGKVGREDKPKRRPPNKPNQNKPNQTAQADLPVNKSQQIGVTLWHLLTTTYKGMEQTLPIPGTDGRSRFLTPVRVSLDTLFESGDYVRLSFEASRRGYLYVIDQEMYADGTLGDAMLVFPNKRIRKGANLVMPGKPVELPDLKGNPFYFELRPQNADGKTIISEVLSVIITDKPIAGLTIGEQPILISPTKLAEWRKKWAGRAEIFERENAAAEGYTKAEREAANGTGKLTASDPLPNTVFLVESNRSGGALITVPLWYGEN